MTQPKTAKKPLPHEHDLRPEEQLICIDLPGEEYKIRPNLCYPRNKVYVVLRRHRDVIFDIRLGLGSNYELEADQDIFYDPKDGKQRKQARFADGERYHIWLPRNFKGNLTLKSNGKTLASYTIRQLDPRAYSDDPDEKPAPVIIALGVHGSASPTQGSVLTDLVNQGGLKPSPFGSKSQGAKDASPIPIQPHARDRLLTLNGQNPRGETDNHETMHVIEVRPAYGPEVPQQIAEFFKKGGEETAIDTTGLLTRNWLWSQIVGGAAYYSDNQHWIKELWGQKFYLQKVVHKNAGTKWYVVFKGNPTLRTVVNAARLGAANAKVLAITSGAGSAQGMRHAAWEATKGGFKKAGLLSVLFTITLDTAEWICDYEQRDPVTGKPKKDFFDLVFKIGVDFAKAGISAALGTVAMAGALMAAVNIAAVFGATLVAPVSVVVIGTIAFAIGIGIAMDWIDKKTGATDSLKEMLRQSSSHLQEKLPFDYVKYDGALQQALAYGGMGA